MNDWEEKRRKEIEKLFLCQDSGCYISDKFRKKFEDTITKAYSPFYDKIIQQEKEMIREAYEEGYVDAQKEIRRWF